MGASDLRLVAVVDDEPAICDSLEMLLRAAGYDVRTFLAAEALLREPLMAFACAIVDLRLRGMSGLELQAELSRRKTPLPIIVITAHGDEKMRLQAMRGGSVKFLTKPFDGETLLEAVRVALQR